MSAGIYVIKDDGQLVEMKEKVYDSEDLLQKLIADYPNLLAGDQIDGAEPRRWLLVTREAPVPDRENGSARWSVDHLFLDQDGIPTFVEVKRSSDTRIRREVVGQMLDYAANAVVYWPMESIRSMFERQCQLNNDSSEAALVRILQPEGDGDTFWQKVKVNLQGGRVRLVFVADEIPQELQRIVEFLNEQMDPAEVIAIEMKQYMGEGLKTLVPRIIGQTAQAQQKKGVAREERQWSEESFFPELEARRGKDQAAAARKILDWAKSKATRIYWGRGSQSGSFVPILSYNGQDYSLLAVYTYGTVEIYFQYYRTMPPFDSEAKRKELLARLNDIDDISIPMDGIARRPGIQLSQLTNHSALERFLGVLEWIVEQVTAKHE